ncbi:hypothetical protein sS8_5176 [Methylocaldum marinum]|uniref:Uncharacterized protein n=1 Tax=Methylocaldum marinum TaxID=1432792 RepID=A0A250KZJ2_9GAMM|nr:hypothetical protein sS8_5176 [Methylocaldum marinum]
MQDRHLKYAITLFGPGVSMLHSEHPQAITRVNVSFDSLRERWQKYNRPYPDSNEFDGSKETLNRPSPSGRRLGEGLLDQSVAQAASPSCRLDQSSPNSKRKVKR